MDFIPTDHLFENEYPKLVRDNIPDIVKAKTGKDVTQRILETDDEYLKYLLKKLIEESKEAEQSVVNENNKEELADVLEIMYAILKLKGWSMEDIVAVQKEKREKNGGFEKRILMMQK